MTVTFPLIVFFISAVFLIRSGSVIVTRLSRVAYFFQMSEFAVSFALIALATSLPDFFVGVSAALHGNPELAFSNIVGANIITLTLAAGIAVIMARGLLVRSDIVRRDAIYASFAAFLPVLLFLDGVISRVDGVILLLFVSWYFSRLFYQRERFTRIFSNTNHGLVDFGRFINDLFVLSVAIMVLVASAEVLTRSALAVAASFGIAIPVIGILLVALSITLPEIVFGARAILMGHEGMVLGNLIGSVIINSGLIIGITALISPIRVDSFSPYLVAIVFTAIVALMFALFAHTNKKISLTEGVLLIGVYGIFVFLTLT